MFPVAAEQSRWPRLLRWFATMQQLDAYKENRIGLAKLREIVQKMGKFEFPSTD